MRYNGLNNELRCLRVCCRLTSFHEMLRGDGSPQRVKDYFFSPFLGLPG